MKFLTHLSLSVAASVVLAGCVTGPVLAPAGAFEAGSYTVPLSQDWTAIEVKTGKGKPAQLLTMDGVMLNSLYLFSDLEEGDSFLKERKRENPVPKFVADMSDLELVEFLSDSLERGNGLLNVTPKNIEPATFGGADAVRFDFTTVNENGLNITGSTLMGIKDDKLNIILYYAPSMYYYDKLKSDVEAIFRDAA